MRISVVEDSPAILAMIETILALHGHIVETYNNALSFLSALQKAGHGRPYDLVIVDLCLGRQSGTVVIEALQAIQPHAIPTILISAAGEGVLAPVRKRYPYLPILQKPFKMQALVSLIDGATPSVEMV